MNIPSFTTLSTHLNALDRLPIPSTPQPLFAGYPFAPGMYPMMSPYGPGMYGGLQNSVYGGSNSGEGENHNISVQAAADRSEPAEGPVMDLAVFLQTYQLEEHVRQPLEAAAVKSPADINHLTYTNYLKPQEGGGQGLGMLMKPAKRLEKAMVAWRGSAGAAGPSASSAEGVA